MAAGPLKPSSYSMKGDSTELMYEVGDKVVYPHHGAGAVIKKEKRDVLGQKREYLTIQILHNDMTVMVPVDSANGAGLRKAIGKTDVSDVIAVLRREKTQMPKNWNHRLKHNRGKLKSGAIFEVADVVRNLSLRERENRLLRHYIRRRNDEQRQD